MVWSLVVVRLLGRRRWWERVCCCAEMFMYWTFFCCCCCRGTQKCWAILTSPSRPSAALLLVAGVSWSSRRSFRTNFAARKKRKFPLLMFHSTRHKYERERKKKALYYACPNVSPAINLPGRTLCCWNNLYKQELSACRQRLNLHPHAMKRERRTIMKVECIS